MSFIIAIILVIFLAIVVFILYYNRFVKLKHEIDESWSGIDVQLKRRADLIPNLVEIVKGYAAHEKETLERVIKARASALSANTIDAKMKAENMLTDALKQLFALVENYPELKASQSFIELQRSLTEVEDAIQMARRYFNATTRDYNILCDAFPSVIVANMLNFKKRPFFELEEEDREPVKVKF